VLELPANERCLVPSADLVAHWPRLVAARSHAWGARERAGAAVSHVLARLEREGPLAARAFDADRVEGQWDTAGRPATKASSLALEVLWREGRVAVRERRGGERLFDLFERVAPALALAEARAADPAAAARRRLDAYLRAVRLGAADDPRLGWTDGGAGERARLAQAAVDEGWARWLEVEGGRGRYLARTADLACWRGDAPASGGGGGAATSRLLAPLDNRLWDRRRLARLFDFAYRWEAYVPAARRGVGPYGMPLMVGDELWGQADARFERASRRLVLRPASPRPDVRAAAYRRALGHAGRDLAAILARFDGGGRVGVAVED
jgi:uncharacterized protein YcaQ